ncbi:MAG: hypothetical protein ACLQGP_04530 [Isosphaeraceae bacterium]
MATTILGIVREGKIVPQTALPDGLQVQITVPEEVVIPEEVATAMTEQAELPDELSLELAGLEHLDDEALWQAARSRLAAVMARRTEKLHQKRQREGLTGAEARALAELLRQYERAMLIRAWAAALLKQRGHDVSKLIDAP